MIGRIGVWENTVENPTWLVVQPPLWKIWTSIRMIIPNINGKINNVNQTTNQQQIHCIHKLDDYTHKRLDNDWLINGLNTRMFIWDSIRETFSRKSIKQIQHSMPLTWLAASTCVAWLSTNQFHQQPQYSIWIQRKSSRAWMRLNFDRLARIYLKMVIQQTPWS